MSDWSLYDRGFSLFPVHTNTKRPAVDWDCYQEQRAAPAQITAWSAHSYNTGIATGAVSNCIVLDCDNALARALAEQRGIPDTLTFSTPRGTHFVFRHPGWPVSNRAGRGWTRELDGVGVDGWDLRGDGGYIVGPGSTYVPSPDEAEKGKVAGTYRIERDAPIAPAPDWLLALTFPKAHKPNVPARTATETTNYGRAALNDEVARIMATTPGDGSCNQTMNDAAFAVGQLVGGGQIEPQEAWGALWEALCTIGVDGDGKSPGTLQRGFDAGQLVPRAPDPVEPVTTEQALGSRLPVAPPPPNSTDEQIAAPPDDDDDDDDYVRPSLLVRGQTVWHEHMASLFSDCWYVKRRKEAFVRGDGLVSPTTFDTIFGGFEFPTTVEGTKKTKSAWDAFRTSPSWSCPMVYDICFRPDKTPGAVVSIEGRAFINTYERIQTKRVAGDPAPFLGLLEKLLPIDRDRQILTSYMCSLVQNPGRKFQWWPVLQGMQGNGKTLILTALAHAVGQRYTHLVNPEAMGKTGNQFNGWITGNLFVGVEEIFVSDQRHILETFKPMITNVRTPLESKGVDQTTGDNFANGIMLTNHRDGVPISDKDRRYAIFWTAQQELADLARDGMDGLYFPDLYDWMHGRGQYAELGENYGLSVVNNWLQTTAPAAEFNPAGICQRAPRTSSTEAAIVESLGTLEQEVLEAIGEQRPGFRGGWITSHALRALFQSVRITLGPKRYRALVGALGYVQHPAFADGRVTNALRDGTRPRLYVLQSSPQYGMTQAEAVAAFEAAQEGINVAAGGNVVPLRGR